MSKKNKTQQGFTWVLLRDGFILDGCFDTLKEAEEAERYNSRNYVGSWRIRTFFTEKEFKKFIGSPVGDVKDLELVRGLRNLTHA